MADKRAKQRPSMIDVGRLANVSAQTVSRYFTGAGYVGDDTRVRIAAAINQLGYIPNASARNLRASRTNTIGVLAVGALNYGSAGVLTGLALAAREDDVTVLITLLDLDFDVRSGWEPEARRALDHFLAFPVDGVVLSTPVPGAKSLLTPRDEQTPLVLVSELPWSDDGSVGTHSYSAGVDATRHLITLGHSRILHVAGPPSRNEARERERGYLDAMSSANLEPRVIAAATDWSSVSGFEAGKHADPATFTGVFAANDELALGFMSAMERRGARAPLNYSIVGVDDMPTAAYFSPPLTTTRLDFKELGRATFAKLRHHIITGERAEHFTVEPELVIRESTAPLAETQNYENTKGRTSRPGLRVARPEGFEPPTF